MKIVYLTAGAAGMYCGSCMHDNTLARAISDLGVDIELVPTYTPIRTDEFDVSVDQVFFGGINVYLQQKIPLFRYFPGFLDRFLDNPWLIRRVTRNASNVSPSELGKLAYSMLQGLTGKQRKEVKRLVRWLKRHSKPDLVLFSNLLIGGCIPAIANELGVPCYVTLQGDDIFLDSLPEQYREACIGEMAKLDSFIEKYLTHSQFYADRMSEYLGIERKRISQVPLGIDTSDFHRLDPDARESRAVIGYLARLAPEKGLDRLVDAFIHLKTEEQFPRAKLRIAGWLGSNNEAYAKEQFDRLKQAGLENEFEYLGTVERHTKLEFLHSLDVFSVPTVYHEPKGLFVLEAMAAGVPVVQPNHGAFPEIIRSTRGGILFPPDDVKALARSLADVLTDQALHRQLSHEGYQSVYNERNSLAMALGTLKVLGIDPPETPTGAGTAAT